VKVFYMTPGCFDKGGISRYSRYQLTALREIYGENNVRAISMLGPQGDSFDVFWHANGNGFFSKLRFIGKVLL
jgi:phosphatidylinositol alpha-1,6-mannosyltransferase